MNIKKVTTDMGEYKVTYHKGSELIEIEEKQYRKTVLSGDKHFYKTIYMGFPSVLEKALEVYNKSKADSSIFLKNKT